MSKEAYRVASNLQRFDFAEKRLTLEALGVTVYADGREWRLEVSIPLSESAGKALPTSKWSGRPKWRPGTTLVS
jgi:hypothetical protein